MKKLALYALSLAATLPLAVNPAHAAGTGGTLQGNPIVQAQGDNSPSIALFVDGNVQADPQQLSQQVNALFAGAIWIVTDQGQGVVGHAQGNQLQGMPLEIVSFSKDNSAFVVHGAGQGLALNGLIAQNQAGSNQGFAILDLVAFDGKGDMISAHVEQALTWQSSNQTGGSGGTGGSSSGGSTGGSPFGGF